MLVGKIAKYEGRELTIVSDFLVMDRSIKMVLMDSEGQLIRADMYDVRVVLDSKDTEFVSDWNQIEGG